MDVYVSCPNKEFGNAGAFSWSAYK
jgi:hypothetical protein